MRAFINVNRKRAETVKGKPAVLQVQYSPHPTRGKHHEQRSCIRARQLRAGHQEHEAMTDDSTQKNIALLPPWRKHGGKYVREDPFDGERATHIRCRTVSLRRARADHMCFGLGGQQDHGIQAGDFYRHERANVDGRWGEYKMCLACMDAYIEGRY